MTIVNSKSSIVNCQSVLFLDPSSTVVGWAVMSSATQLIEAGRITPAGRADPYIKRCDDMAVDLSGLLNEHRPATVVIEIPTGKVHRRKRPYTQGMGLSVYGFGVGVTWLTCRRWADAAANMVCDQRSGHLRRRRVVTIFENDWTRGVPKRDRQLAIALMFDAYKVPADPGGDVADAIGLGLWWFRRFNLEGK